MNIDDLKRLIDDDEFGLLSIKLKTAKTSLQERLINTFLEINEFFQEHHRPPQLNQEDMIELSLYKRLKNIKSDHKKTEFLKEYDDFGFLNVTNPINSIEDVFLDDDFGLLGSSAESIFTIKHIPKCMNMPDYIAQRKLCKDFFIFEDTFKECHADLKAGLRKLRPFAKAQQIDKGHFFVLKGVSLYVAGIVKQETTAEGRANPRLRCIFENGTECDLLSRSLAAELYKDGRRITEKVPDGNKIFETTTNEDTETGYIYIVKSLSTDPKICSIKNLYKIGFSRAHPKNRLKNVESDPTFLQAAVRLINSYRCFNLNPQKLEFLLHSFFASVCLDVHIANSTKKQLSPREWFIVPLLIIEEAIDLLKSGEISNYRYDHEHQRIIGK